MASSSEMKRYNLVIPQELFDEVQRIADREHATVVEVLRRFIRIGLKVVEIEDTPDAAVLVRVGDTERELIFV